MDSTQMKSHLAENMGDRKPTSGCASIDYCCKYIVSSVVEPAEDVTNGGMADDHVCAPEHLDS
jgi:hypothetical protein